MTLQERIAQLDEQERKRKEELMEEDVLPPELKLINSTSLVMTGLKKRNIQAQLQSRRFIEKGDPDYWGD